MYAGEQKLIKSVYPYFVLQNKSKMVRGTATQCMTAKCGSIMEASRLRAHIYKNHVPLTDTPFYCTLCTFRAENKVALDRHVGGYPLHRTMMNQLRLKGEALPDKAYLKTSATPPVC
jgi:hypothetical protein